MASRPSPLQFLSRIQSGLQILMGTQVTIYFFRHRGVNSFYLHQFFHRSLFDFRKGTEMFQQIFLTFFPHTGNIIQYAGQIALASEAAMIRNGKPMRFVLHTGNEQEHL